MRTTDQLAYMLTKGNIHHDAMTFFVDFVANQTTLCITWCPKLFSQTFLLLSFWKDPSDVSDDDTQTESVDQMWSEYASKVLRNLVAFWIII